MKFAEHLSAHITPEWRKQYINYEEMKEMLYSCMELAPPDTEEGAAATRQRYLTNFDEIFFHYCEEQLTKINTFYSEKLAEASRKYAGLQSELQERESVSNGGGVGGKGGKGVRRLRLPFSEFYLSLVLLQNYQNLNFTGFRKILKKHDKLMNSTLGGNWRAERVEASHFYTSKEIDRLISEVEHVVSSALEGGDRARAMRRLRVPPLGHRRGPWTTFRLGLFSGCFTTLAIVVVLSALYHRKTEDWSVFLRLFRGPFLLVLFLWLWAGNVYGWRTSGVNHVLIFSLDPRHNMSEQHAGALAGAMGTLGTLACLAHLHRGALGLTDVTAPLCFYIVTLGFLINPLRVLHFEGRVWLLKVLGRIVLAPFFYVGFSDFWVAEQLTSLVPVFLDIHFTLCYAFFSADYCSSSPSWVSGLVSALPAWWRCLQCLRRLRDTGEPSPHLPNAIKYASSFILLLLASLCTYCPNSQETLSECAWLGVWLGFGGVAALSGYLWDVRLDWGLLDASPGDMPLLRQETVYTSTWFYYFGLAEDLVLRLCWAVSVSFTETGYKHSHLIVTILAILEVFRRFIWNFFRLENEHLNNCGKFRAVRDISVAPVDSGDQAAILRLMDHPGDDPPAPRPGPPGRGTTHR